MIINNFNNGLQNQAPQAANGNLANNSGQGKDSPVLDIVANRFNWGAFLLTWIWGLGNRAYITLLVFVGTVLSFIPFIGWLVPLGLGIWFGIKGNTWAWQNKKWQSVEHFHAVQRKWALAGVIVLILTFVFAILLIVLIALPIFMNSSSSAQDTAMIKNL